MVVLFLVFWSICLSVVIGLQKYKFRRLRAKYNLVMNEPWQVDLSLATFDQLVEEMVKRELQIIVIRPNKKNAEQIEIAYANLSEEDKKSWLKAAIRNR